MVGVGALAAILNVGVLLTVAVADRAIELIVRNFAVSRLHHRRCAPIVHDSDTWLPNLPRSVLKYRRHPAILATVLCTFFLIVSELVTEVGVDTSLKCSPAPKQDIVIKGGNTRGAFTTVELGASTFFLQSLQFLDGNLTRVPAGLPKRLTGRECLVCMNKKEYPDIVSGCTVKTTSAHRAGKLEVGIRTTQGAFGTITEGFREVSGEKRTFTGEGDLTGNGMRRAMFLFPFSTNEAGNTLEYFEYSHQGHANAIIEKAKEQNGTTIWQKTLSDVYVWSIKCDVNQFDVKKFRKAVMIYRTIQLENPAFICKFDDKLQRFNPISPQDVYRAILSVKVIDDDDARGTYMEYTACGVYKWKFLAPILVCILILVVLGLFSWYLARDVDSSRIPYNSRTWRKYVSEQKGGGIGRSDANRSGYFESMHDEMVLIDDQDIADQPRLAFRSRTKAEGKPKFDDSIDAFYCQKEAPDSYN